MSDETNDVKLIQLPAGEHCQPWTIHLAKGDEPWRFTDATGRDRGRYLDAETMAAHFAFCQQRLDKAEAELDRLRAENAELREIGRVWNKEPPKVEGMYLLCDEGVVYCVRIYHDNIWKELWVNLSSFSKPLSDVHRGSWYGPIPSPQEPKWAT